MERKIRRGDPQRQSYWEDVVRRWREGGRSVRDYCRAEGLRESAFYFWRRKLERPSRPSGTVGQSPTKALGGCLSRVVARRHFCPCV